jgi:predicted nucleic acid-binding protein
MAIRLEVVVDATSLISALLGGRAIQVLFSDLFQCITTERTTWEVKRYIPTIADRSGVAENEVLYLFETFPLTAYQSAFYEAQMDHAARQVGERDSNDIDILALTYQTGAPLWTADRDLLEVADIQTVTTDDLWVLVQKE